MPEVTEVHTEGGGVGSGMVIGIALILVVLAVAAFVIFGGGLRPSTAPAQPTSGPTNIQVNPPASAPKVDVQVNPAPQAPAPQAPAPQAPAPQAPAQQAPAKP